MKRNIFLLVSASILVMVFSAFTFSTEIMSKANHKIALLNRSGGTRSVTVTEVEAFLCDDYTLTVEVKNYTGMVWVDVTGSEGTRQESVQVYDNACIVIDLSTLLHEDYLLTITLNNELYEGYFEH